MSTMTTPDERRAERAARAEAIAGRRADRELAANVRKVRGLKIARDRIEYKGAGGPIAGAHARVETAGDVDRRITATRVLATGFLALAWRKKKDSRELFLTVEGDGFAFVVPIDPDDGLAARQIAARVNALAAA